MSEPQVPLTAQPIDESVAAHPAEMMEAEVQTAHPVVGLPCKDLPPALSNTKLPPLPRGFYLHMSPDPEANEWRVFDERDMREYAMAAIAAHEAAKWQPIETAPRDGTEILAWREDCGWMMARYTCADNLRTMSDRERDELDEESLFKEDWFGGDSEQGGERMEGSEVPTLWLPLPADPPSGAASEAVSGSAIPNDGSQMALPEDAELDAAGNPKLPLTALESVALDACNLVKAWAESDRATALPEEAHALVDAVLMMAAQRRKGVQ